MADKKRGSRKMIDDSISAAQRARTPKTELAAETEAARIRRERAKVRVQTAETRR